MRNPSGRPDSLFQLEELAKNLIAEEIVVKNINPQKNQICCFVCKQKYMLRFIQVHLVVQSEPK